EGLKAIRDEHDGEESPVPGEAIDLLDEDIEASAVLVVRLHLGPTRTEIVALVDDQDARALGNLDTRLVERSRDALRELPHETASADIRRRFEHDDPLVERLRDDGADGGREHGLAAAHLASENHELRPVLDALCKREPLGVMLPRPAQKALRVEDA